MSTSSRKREKTKIEACLWEFPNQSGPPTYYWTPTVDGQTLWNKLDATNRTEAKQEKRQKDKRETRQPRTKTPMETAAENFFAKLDAKTRRREKPLEASTVELYRNHYRVHIEPTFGELRVDEITPDLIGNWASGLELKVGTSAQCTIVGIFRRLLRDAIPWGTPTPFDLINPEALPKKKTKKKEVVVPAVPDIYRFLGAVTEDFRMAVTLITFTGMRVGEAIALRWSDLDFELGAVLPRRKINSHGEGDTKTPAGSSAKRVIPMLPFLKTELELHRAAEIERGYGRDNDYVLTNMFGGSFDRNNIRYRGVVPAAKDAGLGKVTTHDLRHWYASTLEEAGVSRSTIKAILGHADNDDVTGGYIHSAGIGRMLVTVERRCLEIGFGAALGETVEADC